MNQVIWFERKFDFSFQQNIFPSIIERLDGTAVRLSSKLDGATPDLLENRISNKWSIKQNIGHLIDLEPLWQGRLDDVLEGKKYLRSADLENKKTDLARHNEKDLEELLRDFLVLRNHTVSRLSTLNEDEIYKSALHPRLEKPMRVMDLFLFVAEHDDHHCVSISEIRKSAT